MAAERCSYEILIRGSKVGHTALTQIDVNSSMVTLALIRPRCEINMSQIIYNHTSFGVVGHMLRTFFFSWNGKFVMFTAYSTVKVVT